MDPVVDLGGEPDGAVVVPDALAARREEGVRHLLAGRRLGGRRVGHGRPGDRTVLGDEHRLERASREVGVGVGRIAVEQALGVVLGEVHHLIDRVDGRRLVGPVAHGRVRHRLVDAGRVALPDQSGPDVGLLAGQPGAPRGDAAGAVRVAALEDAVGIEDPAVGVEVDRRHAAQLRARREEVEDLRVAGVVPAALAVVEGGRPVGEQVPLVAGVADRVAADSDDAGGEALGQDQAVLVGLDAIERAVGPVARCGHVDHLGRGHPGGGERAGPHCGGHAASQERSSVHRVSPLVVEFAAPDRTAPRR